MKHREPSQPPETAIEAAAANSSASRLGAWVGPVCVVAATAFFIGPEIWQPELRFGPKENAQIAEASAWWSGRLDLSARTWDTALKDGRVYSHLPPLFSVIAGAVLAFETAVPQWFLGVTIVLPVAVLACLLFRLRTDSAWWGAVLALGFVCGTSLLPAIKKSLEHGTPYFINHVLGTIGLLVMLFEAMGPRRGVVAAIGLVTASLSRQVTFLYVIPLALAAREIPTGEARRRFLLPIGLAVLVVVGSYAMLNAAKFGSPFDSGYLYIYEDRPEDWLAKDAKTHGLFSLQFVARNWNHMNVGLPEIREVEDGSGDVYLWPNDKGTGIWWTTPLLLWLLVDLRRILADPARRTWLGASCVVIAVLLLFHNTGWEQLGFNRFSLDYVPVLLALCARRAVTGRWRWLSAGMIAWSVYYFGFLI